MFRWDFFLFCFFFVVFRFFLFHVESRLSPVMMFLFFFFFLFFFYFLLEFLLYSGCSFTCSGLTNVVFKGCFFFFCVGVNQCWGLKVFSVEVTNVGFERFLW